MVFKVFNCSVFIRHPNICIEYKQICMISNLILRKTTKRKICVSRSREGLLDIFKC